MARTVKRVRLGAWIDPQDVFVHLFGESQQAFWLDNGADSTSGFSYVGDGEPTATIESHGPHEDAEFLDSLEASNDIDTTSPDLAELDFRLGWVGWFCYEFGVRRIGGPHAPSPYPDAAFVFADRAVVFDHGERTVSALVIVDNANESHSALRDHVEWVTRVRDCLAELSREAEPGAAPPLHTVPSAIETSEATTPRVAEWRHTDQKYLTLIEECQRVIARGDAYQLCLTNTVNVPNDSTAAPHDPVATYVRLRKTSSSHHGGYLRIGETALLSASPERFLRIFPDRTVETSPIKGTRARGRTREEDEQLQRELVESPKEQAENLMIVDLTRNDLSRVCVVGSVAVTRLLALETYPHVHQLVSTVRGVLRPEISFADVLSSTFPAGSMTGAPKRSAIHTLFDLERGPRGIYSGTFGYVGIDGSVDLAMVIRSIVIDCTGATVGAGGGITALSDPGEELEEAHLKSRALLRALATGTD